MTRPKRRISAAGEKLKEERIQDYVNSISRKETRGSLGECSQSRVLLKVTAIRYMDGDGRRIAIEILRDKGDTRGLGHNWHLSFLQRHPDLKTRISAPRSMDRILAQDRSTFIAWFNLFLKQEKQYEVYDDDVYNMDEKGVALGVAGKLRVIIPKTEKNPHTSGGSGSRDCNGNVLPDRTFVTFLDDF
ncbi:hypothetical protein V8E54_014094 [Elaphomyces granulatus]